MLYTAVLAVEFLFVPQPDISGDTMRDQSNIGRKAANIDWVPDEKDGRNMHMFYKVTCQVIGRVLHYMG